MRKMSLSDCFNSSNSVETASCSVLTASAASRPMSKQKFADANDLEVDNLKHVRLCAYPVSMFGARKRCFNAAWYQSWDWLEYSVKFDAAFWFS